MTPVTPHGNTRRLAALLVVFLIVRVILLIFLPHQDPSEARYAEIARKMVETGDWITPQHAYGVPFWAKPPLSMWMSALGMEIFGVNEFGSRFFIFIAALVILFLVGRFAWREWSLSSGLTAAVILLAMPLFFYCSGAVMTDTALLLGTTLSMISFIHAVRKDGSRAWGYLFFAGLAVGLLAKGPLVLVIVSPPLLAWTIFSGAWPRTWDSIPWLTGPLLMAAVVLPWYSLAEQRTPGFIDYFIVGEHWNRFFRSGWTGDLYGKAHAVPPGMIWIFLILTTLPWCLGFLSLPFNRWRDSVTWARKDDGLGFYLIMWAFWPIVFFTPARNVILTYPLPALPAIALLLAWLHCGHLKDSPARRFHPLHPALVTVSLLIVLAFTTMSLFFPERSPKHSERELARVYRDLHGPQDPLLYFGRRRYSAEFYTSGAAIHTRSLDELVNYLERPGTLFLAIPEEDHDALPEGIQRRLRIMRSFEGQMSLYQEIPPDYSQTPSHPTSY
ncbi:MAG: glycosyltransferase family 39 protein [Akkermansiaceae bacterium]|nr:glycosyltransferase family 39 protein [Akkermansiaceae bacterium]